MSVVLIPAQAAQYVATVSRRGEITSHPRLVIAWLVDELAEKWRGLETYTPLPQPVTVAGAVHTRGGHVIYGDSQAECLA